MHRPAVMCTANITTKAAVRAAMLTHVHPCTRTPYPRVPNKKLKMCVSLLPSDIGDIYAGIRRNIYQFLMRYNESLGGVLLAVSELSFGDGAREGRIEDEMPHIHFDVKAKAQVFCPRPGHVLEGRVNKVRLMKRSQERERGRERVKVRFWRMAVGLADGQLHKTHT